MDRNLTKAFNFFKEHSGYVVGSRAIGALNLAKAEKIASERGWEVSWEDDPEGPSEHLGDHEVWCARARRNAAEEKTRSRGRTVCQHECYYAVIKNADGEVLGSLGGILDPDRDYMRVVAAELALEAWGEEERKAALPKFTSNTDNVDIRAGAVGLSVHEGIADRGLHVQIRHNRDPKLFEVACKMQEIIKDAVNAAIERGDLIIPKGEG